VLFLSLGVLVRSAGMVSLCQVSFAAVGAAGFGHLAGASGLPWLPSLLLAGLFAVPFGAVVAIPAIRLSGLYLALATLGFGILMQQEMYSQSFLFGSFARVLNAPRPGVLGLSGDKAFYYLLLIALGLSIALVAAIGRSRLGRLLRGMADSPTALSTHGTNIQVTRVLVFCLSAFLAGVSGALYSQLSGKINADSFQAFTSLILVAVLVIAGRGAVSSALIASLAYFVVPAYINSARLNDYLGVIFGVAAMLAALASARPAGSLAVGTRFANPARRGSRIAARTAPAVGGQSA
jgi:ABC-type branched-subunit amino acid transport system permease subunit